MPILKPRRSRRVEPLKDSDYDHEINLLDHSSPIPQKQTPDEGALRTSVAGPSDEADLPSPRPQPAARHRTNSGGIEEGGTHTHDNGHTEELGPPALEVEQPTPISEDVQRSTSKRRSKPRRRTPQSAIDILYENQRGGFLCGIPLFSSKALGNLDPPPWTNFAHKPSPTDIKTAQVPDPSWEWAWPEWKINHDRGVDEDGWEYSFAFSKRFSWHGPKWWNSFVRRRAWIRKRVKKDTGYVQEDPSMLNAQYFAVRPASVASPDRSPSRAHSRRTSKASVSNSQVADLEELERPDIVDLESLMRALRASRIDREKIEAIANYLEHSEDSLGGLEAEMHEIMSLFVFQASRRVLLTKLSQVHEQTLKSLEDQGGSAELRQKAENLTAAIKHADEEVKRLEYWSDVKEIVVERESKAATDYGRGWDETWRGLDNSGPAEPSAPANGPTGDSDVQ